ncbi:MAG: signal peptide peptidase SppA [Treponema sp.]|nr:signal peptide peptidase SppA [Treponema sp.]
MKKKTLSGAFIFLIIIGLIAAAVLFFKSDYLENKVSTTLSSKIYGNQDVKKTNQKKNKNNSEFIAAIYIEGEIEELNYTYDQKWLLNTIKELKEDEKNLGIALFINSPGGAVYEADEVYLALKDYKKEGKKIYTYMGALAASGGYYISCASNKIYANRNTLTGSIGVISGQVLDATDMMDKIGLKSETIHAGRNKNMGNFNEPISDEQRAILQGIADECYDQFTGIVADDRKIPLEKVKELADGRIYTAKQALELKLIDKIDSWDNMISDFKKNELNKEECEVIDYKVNRQRSLSDLFGYSAKAITTNPVFLYK